MPEIVRFYGIIIKLFFGDHPPPHFHAVYSEYNALFNMETLEMIEGDLPQRAKKMVIEWATMYQKELIEMWNNQEFRKLPPLR
jgi:serine/threonine-protein kinase RIO1